jgi:hypothetical protein
MDRIEGIGLPTAHILLEKSHVLWPFIPLRTTGKKSETKGIIPKKRF